MLVEVFNTREIANGIWLLILVGWAGTLPGVRQSFPNLLCALFQRKLVTSFLSFVLYTTGLVAILHYAGLWSPVLLKDTVLWATCAGPFLLFHSVQSGSDTSSWRRLIAGQVTPLIFLTYLVNTYTFSLGIELVLAPCVALVTCMTVVAEYQKDAKAVAKFGTSLLACIGFVVIAFALQEALVRSNTFVLADALRTIALPVVLSVLTLPCAYAVALWSAYDDLFVRLRCGEEAEGTVFPYARRRMFLKFGLHLEEVRAFTRKNAAELISAASKDDVDHILDRWERDKSVDALPFDPASTPQVRVVRTRIAPFTTAMGVDAQKLFVDWKNVGSVPVKQVWARISAYDHSDVLLQGVGCTRYCIFATDEEKAIVPGKTFVPPDHSGFVLLSWDGKVSRVDVDVLEVR